MAKTAIVPGAQLRDAQLRHAQLQHGAQLRQTTLKPTHVRAAPATTTAQNDLWVPLGFGRIVVSEIETPNLLLNLV